MKLTSILSKYTLSVSKGCKNCGFEIDFLKGLCDTCFFLKYEYIVWLIGVLIVMLNYLIR